MAKLPTVTGREVIAVFQTFGFEVRRQKGSHVTMAKEGHRFLLTVPVHGTKPMNPGTLRSLIRNAGISVDEFIEQQNR